MKKFLLLVAIALLCISPYVFSECNNCRDRNNGRGQAMNVCVKQCMREGIAESLADCVSACDKKVDRGQRSGFGRSNRYPF